MASIDDCEAALARLGAALDGADHRLKKQATDRTLSCRVTDLAVTFCAELSDGQLVDIRREDNPEPAQIKVSVTSDDLVSLVDGELAFPHAWATGRVKLDASLRDLLRLRSLLG